VILEAAGVAGVERDRVGAAERRAVDRRAAEVDGAEVRVGAVGDSMITSTPALVAASVWVVVFVQPWLLSVNFSV